MELLISSQIKNQVKCQHQLKEKQKYLQAINSLCKEKTERLTAYHLNLQRSIPTTNNKMKAIWVVITALDVLDAGLVLNVNFAITVEAVVKTAVVVLIVKVVRIALIVKVAKDVKIANPQTIV